jgi:molecular chaperone DnaK (HSP70)
LETFGIGLFHSFERVQVDAVELLGGTGRIPIIQEVVLRVSGIGKLNRTMNSDEAVALGAAYIGAAQSADFITTKRVKFDPFCDTNVSLMHNGVVTSLFNQSDHISDSTPYQFKSCDNGHSTLAADSAT